MPCNSDYLNPTGREQQLQEVAIFYKWSLEQCGLVVPEKVKEDARSIYGGGDYIGLLCDLLRASNPSIKKKLLEQPNKMSRNLANWWDDHQEADRRRIRGEKIKAKNEAARRTALKKLTPEERRLLGFKNSDNL